jgi:SAM-dependent methyltransferase
VELLGLRSGQVLLDLACGRTGCRLVGVDFSAVAISQATRRAAELGIPAEFQVGQLTATGLGTASADAVMIVDAYQFAEPELDALRERLRVLRPGGRLVITAGNPPTAQTPDCRRGCGRSTWPGSCRQRGSRTSWSPTGPGGGEIEHRYWQESLTLDAGDDLATAPR